MAHKFLRILETCNIKEVFPKLNLDDYEIDVEIDVNTEKNYNNLLANALSNGTSNSTNKEGEVKND